MQPSNYLFLDLQYQRVIVAIHEVHIFHLRHQGYRYLQYLVLLGIKLLLRKVGISVSRSHAKTRAKSAAITAMQNELENVARLFFPNEKITVVRECE